MEINKNELMLPDYIFEASWEVCNKVGGIYTVLSTKTQTLVKNWGDRLIYIGPNCNTEVENSNFNEDKNLFNDWVEYAQSTEKLNIKVGRWDIPGKPIAILVDFAPFMEDKNRIYGEMWNDYKVDSLHAYGDYDEASMFAYATGKVVESFYKFYLLGTDKSVVYQAHEWMMGFSALYLQKAVPQIATIFTTHATSIGRSIAGNDKPLYDYLFAYNGDQMAQELNMEAKHSVEKQTAHHVDCFTTVSDITNKECKELLDKEADVVLTNGFESDFVPKGAKFSSKRRSARKKILTIANHLMGTNLGNETLIIGTSGRYEFRNKGIDLFLEAVNRLDRDSRLDKNVLAVVSVPGWVSRKREDLVERLKSKKKFSEPLKVPLITHWLHDMTHDQVLDMLKHMNLMNGKQDKVKVMFVPCYLDHNDGIFDMSYYEYMTGLDLTVFPSYYEPWGYTPLESISFRVPTITTDLSGFGLWSQSVNSSCSINTGVSVLHRSDYNHSEVADHIKENILTLLSKSPSQIKKIRDKAKHLAEKASWKHFITNYYQAYGFALRRANERCKQAKQ